ncbi:MAG: DUF423 domain-containing protein [Gammaproteobacteria bacterium]|nr:DUF423 domain-containing protein [Gammaproteobacteria bacterium]
MNLTSRIIIAFVGLNGAIATILAALASHSVIMSNNEYLSSVFVKANNMHFYHLIALLAVAILYQVASHRVWLFSGVMFALGIILFSGSLYLFSFSGAKIAGFLTPLGGVCFIVGWSALLLGALMNTKKISRDS